MITGAEMSYYRLIRRPVATDQCPAYCMLNQSIGCRLANHQAMVFRLENFVVDKVNQYFLKCNCSCWPTKNIYRLINMKNLVSPLSILR